MKFLNITIEYVKISITYGIAVLSIRAFTLLNLRFESLVIL